MDTQIKELIGQHFLADQIMRAGLEVAIPLRDRGIDLIAYSDLGTDIDRYVAMPVQMKAATKTSFSIDRKYDRIQGLLIAYVWHINDPTIAVTYAMTYAEALEIATEMGWTKTDSWRIKGCYANTRPGKRLVGLLDKYKMSTDAWKQRIKNAG